MLNKYFTTLFIFSLLFIAPIEASSSNNSINIHSSGTITYNIQTQNPSDSISTLGKGVLLNVGYAHMGNSWNHDSNTLKQGVFDRLDYYKNIGFNYVALTFFRRLIKIPRPELLIMLTVFRSMPMYLLSPSISLSTNSFIKQFKKLYFPIYYLK